ncbi:GDSL esterase/lipase EXL1-like [Abrus precatorius]|uniref:GDSL esterase/lipase EXL1-like n=1 Tax=Abrus precatorius TaxID=3816 RepID=A0A8B8JF91_ABRPR|nr:GDSL esterase/lipase EXL1-like [Abrus precatorius]
MVLFMKLPSFSSYLLVFLLFRFILLFAVVCKTRAVVKLPPNVSVPAVLVFGDSIMDTGNNNNNLATPARCNFPPYGKDFKGGMPTGRFSNGKVPSDLIVEELGIKEFLPPYLDPNLQPSDLATGVCFASGGAGYDPLTSQTSSVISLSGQVDLFKEYIGKLRGLFGEDRTNFILGNSLFIVVFGSNDISNTYFLSRVRQLQYDFPPYADLMVNSASNFMKEIYELGARRIAVFSVPPIGCLPFQRTAAGGKDRKIVVKYNDAVQLFNSKLSKELDSLNQNFPNARMVYIDVFNPLLDIVVNHKKYGYNIENRGCCGTGTIEVVLLCNRFVPLCANDLDYVFWDSFHPTESVYRKLIAPILAKYLRKFL